MSASHDVAVVMERSEGPGITCGDGTSEHLVDGGPRP